MKRLVVVIAGVFMLATAATGIALAVAKANGSNISTAQARRAKTKVVINRGDELGLVCIANIEECANLIARAKANPRLKGALLAAKEAGVNVHPEGWLFSLSFPGRIGDGYVVVNIHASDERIIRFLIE
jgi:hypothetical protein